ncbi:MAG: lytic transglycosylase domain-containing protein [Acidiferrobacterales bacterium]
MGARVTVAVLIGLLLTGTTNHVEGAMYVYQATDGSWAFTDYALTGSQYTLVRKAPQARGAAIAARSSDARHRGDPAAYDRIIRRMARVYDVDAALIKAVMHAESAFNPYARSRKGASGLMQLMPDTAHRYGVSDIYDPVQNVRAGVRYLSELIEQFNNKMHLVLAAYNAGEGAVKQHKGIPPYAETRKYVKKVLRYKRRYAKKF